MAQVLNKDFFAQLAMKIISFHPRKDPVDFS